MRVGWGFDAHGFSTQGSTTLGGVTVDTTRGVAATSDGDVLAHAVADALLGAAALGDIGMLFPSSDPAWRNADSMALLGEVVRRVHDAGYVTTNLDVTIITEAPRIAPFREAIRGALASALGVPVDVVSLKATSTDGLGFIGRGEGVAAVAVVSLGAGHA